MTAFIGRRQFITLLGGAAAAWPLAARAQQPPMPTVGYLYVASREDVGRVGAFRKGLSEMGYVEGRNVRIEYRWAHNETARLPGLVADLTSRPVTVIAAGDLPSASLAAKRVDHDHSDRLRNLPLKTRCRMGLVASLNRPGANITGVANIGAEIGAKRFGLLNELLPGATRFAALVNPNNPLIAEVWVKDAQAAGGGAWAATRSVHS